MWTREKFKLNAKIFLKIHIKNAIIVCLIFSIFYMIFNSSNEYIPLGPENNYYNLNNIKNDRHIFYPSFSLPINKFSLSYNGFNNGFRIFRNISLYALNTITILILSAIFLIGKIFILNPLSIGKVRYFIKTFENPENDNVGLLFSPFKEDFFLTSLKLLKKIYI